MLKMYTIHDSKVEAYLNPTTVRSTGEMIRIFTDLCNDKEHQFGKYPADYTLLEIGEWDEFTGTLRPYETKKNLGLALDFKKDTISQSPKLMEA